MKRRHLMTLGGVLVLAGCGRAAGLNPFTWFGRAERAEQIEPLEAREAADPRPLVDQVTALAVERTPGGAVIRATGLPPVQGWHTADLVPVATGTPGVLAYGFRALPPGRGTRVSRPASREIVVATYLTNQDLAGVREIRVSGARSVLAVRR